MNNFIDENKKNAYNRYIDTQNREGGVTFMRQAATSTDYTLKEHEKKGLLVIAPIVIGSIVYGACNIFWLFTHIFNSMF